MLIHRGKRAHKKRWRLLLAFILATLCLTPVANAAAPATITFTGETDQFIFYAENTSQNLQFFPDLNKAVPGQKLSQQLLFTNTSAISESVSLYVRAIPEGIDVPLSPVHGSKPMPKELYEVLSQMKMRVWNGRKIIYESGPDRERDMTRPLYLGSFSKNEIDTLTAELTIPENAGNLLQEYPINWVFSVESFNATQRTVTKLWPDGDHLHSDERIKVCLLKDGEPIQEAQLTSENNWTYTFQNLVTSDPQNIPVWSIEEIGAQDENVRYVTEGNITMIYPKNDLPSVMNPHDGIDIQEPEVPLGNGMADQLTVQAIWNPNQDYKMLKTTAVLYNGDYPVDAAVLSEANQWEHTWKDLTPGGNWRIMERNVPGGYVPEYQVQNELVTITNTRAENYAPGVNWEMAIIIGMGLPLAALGVFALFRKKPGQI